MEKYLKRSLAVRVLWAADGRCVLSRVDLGGFAIHQPASGFHSAARKRIAEPVNKQDRRNLWQARLRGSEARETGGSARADLSRGLAPSVSSLIHSIPCPSNRKRISPPLALERRHRVIPDVDCTSGLECSEPLRPSAISHNVCLPAADDFRELNRDSHSEEKEQVSGDPKSRQAVLSAFLMDGQIGGPPFPPG